MANIDLKKSGLRNVKPYHIVRKDGIRIAFLGLSNVERHTGKPSIITNKVEDIKFYDPIRTALEYRNLRKKAHVFVALTHIGINEDLILADAMPELDLILGGHSHTLLEEPLIQNGVLITQAGRAIRRIGKTTILLEKGVVTKITNEIIDLTTWDGPEDPVVAERIKMYEGNLAWEQPFGLLQYEIPNNVQLSYMMTDAAIALPGVDFAVQNLSGIRIDHLPAGPVAYGDILRLAPFNNHLIVVGLKPADIRLFLQQRRDFLSPAGFEYTARRAPNGFIRVEKITYPNGVELDENQTYYLAVSNFLFAKYLSAHSEYATNTEILEVDNIVRFLENYPNVDYRIRPARTRYIKQ
jgi:2',3'-cyclic-nucleotide 2'-phosphodiesterase (5'-nucleotidase family)